MWTNPSYMASVSEDLIAAYAEFMNDKMIDVEVLAVEVVLDAVPVEGAHQREDVIDGEPLVLGLTLV